MEVLVKAGAAATPVELCARLLYALGAPRPQALAACLTRDACLVTPDSTTVRGRADVAAVLVQLPLGGTRVEADPPHVLAAGDAALVSGRWHFASPAPGNSEFRQSTEAVLALSRVEGGWKVSIAAPWGWRGFP